MLRKNDSCYLVDTCIDTVYICTAHGGRGFIPGTVRTREFEELAILECDVASKLVFFKTCRREFGRCTGRVPMGYTFEGVDVADDNTKQWWEYRVTLTRGANPLPGFNLGG